MQTNHILEFKELIKKFSRDELLWINGYLSGILEGGGNPTSLEATPSTNLNSTPAPLIKPTIIYGTETGNSKKVALQLQKLLKQNKIQSKTYDASQYPLDKLEKEKLLLIIMSTQGEGEPPVSATNFYQSLEQSNANLDNTQFCVLGLGDSSYPLFCKAGEDIDKNLEKLGGQRIINFTPSDVDFMPVAKSWFNQILNFIQNSASPSLSIQIETPKIATSIQKKSYTGIVKHKVILNDIGSNKETYHIEIEPEEEVDFQPGDAIGFYPKNNENETIEIAKLLNEEGRSTEFLTKNIRGLSGKSLEKFSNLFKTEIKESKIDLIDLLKKYPNNSIHIDDVLNLLNPISPRLYSIASSPEAHDGELHITVSLDKFKVDGLVKTGLCSQFLSNYTLNETLPFYIHKNNNFRLPAEDKDVIMIGPGTGIAPFRSFIAHRDATGAEGRNWLIFGEQHFVKDFYYQTEIQEWLSTGVLTHLDTAFSRDQKNKIYVQDRLKEHSKKLYDWILNGAFIYICGQKDPMSLDVDKTLIEIIEKEANISKEEATAFLDDLELNGRYQKDVY